MTGSATARRGMLLTTPPKQWQRVCPKLEAFACPPQDLQDFSPATPAHRVDPPLTATPPAVQNPENRGSEYPVLHWSAPQGPTPPLRCDLEENNRISHKTTGREDNYDDSPGRPVVRRASL